MKPIPKWGLIVGVSVIFGSACHGQGGGGGGFNLTPVPTPSRTLTGAVFDPSGAPAPGVVLVAPWPASPPRERAISDRNGKFLLQWRPQPPGDYAYRIIARDVKNNFAAIHAIDETTTNLDLHLQSGLTITFKVEDPAGKPISNTLVRLRLNSEKPGVGGALEMAMEITNEPSPADTGDPRVMRISALPQGCNYGGYIVAAGFGTGGVGPIQSADTQTNRLDLAFVLKPANRMVAGRVLDVDGMTPVARAMVRVNLADAMGQPNAHTLSDATGHFTLEVCEGAVTLAASEIRTIPGPPGSRMQIRAMVSGTAKAMGGDTNVEIKFNPVNVPGPAQPDPMPGPAQPVPTVLPPEMR